MTAPLGLVAGSGRLPFEVAGAARDRGQRVAVVAILDHTDPAIAGLASAGLVWLAPGELGRMIDFMHAAGAREVIFAGAIAKREMLRDPGRLHPDARALAALARLQGRGDDAILRAVAGELESEGLQVVSSTRHLGKRLTPEGPLTAGALAPALLADLALGLRVARTLGACDVGQSVVVRDGVVLAVEALEGTDAALRRGAELGGPGAVLVKTAKPGQDLRFDLPVIGPETVAVARECALRAIGLEAGRTLVLDRERALAAASAAGIAVVGLAGAFEVGRAEEAGA
ncbi:MAG: LpxI family protein [Myxococcota bacterium]